MYRDTDQPTYDSRVLGGYHVTPTANRLKEIPRAAERLHVVVDTIAAAERNLAALNLLLDDTAIALRNRTVPTTWDSLERRTGIRKETLRYRLRLRLRARRSFSPTQQIRLLADDHSQEQAA